MKNEELFESLVKNALDFFQRAIEEIEDNSKYSIIHFFSAIEIMLKARLLFEHWTLIFSDPKDANYQEFEKGNFISVNIHEAIKRIKNIINSHISTEAKTSFDNLRKHRNKLVHFFHPEFGHNANSSEIAKVVADECVAWFHLHKLLTKSWSEQFSKFDGEFYSLNRKMLGLHSYLKVKYVSIKKDIERGKKRGKKFVNCNSCGYETALMKNVIGPIKEKRCVVCELFERTLTVPCPKCENSIIVYDLGLGECEECNEAIDMTFLISHFGEFQSPKEEYTFPSQAYCTNCEYLLDPTVVKWDESYFCLNCFCKFDSVNQCEWCSELNAGDMSNSYFKGCAICEGR